MHAHGRGGVGGCDPITYIDFKIFILGKDLIVPFYFRLWGPFMGQCFGNIWQFCVEV